MEGLGACWDATKHHWSFCGCDGLSGAWHQFHWWQVQILPVSDVLSEHLSHRSTAVTGLQLATAHCTSLYCAGPIMLRPTGTPAAAGWGILFTEHAGQNVLTQHRTQRWLCGLQVYSQTGGCAKLSDR